jgi:multiple sugar transport system permease protein
MAMVNTVRPERKVGFRPLPALSTIGGLILLLLPWFGPDAVNWGDDSAGVALMSFLVGALAFLLGGFFWVSDSKVEKPYRNAVSYFFMSLLAIFLMAPFVWMLLVSLHPSRSPIPTFENLIPAELAFENYQLVIFNEFAPVGRFFLNTSFVVIMVVGLQLLVTSLAAYAFARLQFKFREVIFTVFLLSMMFAGPVTQIPVYLMVRSAGLLDTFTALIVPSIGSAFSVFLLRQFFMQIPKELDEAARIDGAGDLAIYWKVIMPLSKTALATAGVFTFILVWRDFFWPLIAMSSLHKFTLEVGLSFFKNSYGDTNWPLSMAAAMVVMIPLLIVFLFAQRYFVRGITLGSIK